MEGGEGRGGGGGRARWLKNGAWREGEMWASERNESECMREEEREKGGGGSSVRHQ